MDFAKQQLIKYGWKEGDGLGKSQNGIATAIKPKLKMNKEGIGFSAGEEYTNNWWDRVFNEAASNITIQESNDGDQTQIKRKRKKLQIAIKKSKKLKSADSRYTNFFQGSFLEGGTETVINERLSPEPEENDVKIITDEELFKACGGRTAHKGARHGLDLKGKLARLEKQDAIFNQQTKTTASQERS